MDRAPPREQAWSHGRGRDPRAPPLRRELVRARVRAAGARHLLSFALMRALRSHTAAPARMEASVPGDSRQVA